MADLSKTLKTAFEKSNFEFDEEKLKNLGVGGMILRKFFGLGNVNNAEMDDEIKGLRLPQESDSAVFQAAKAAREKALKRGGRLSTLMSDNLKKRSGYGA